MLSMKFSGTDAATNLIKKLKGKPKVTKEDLEDIHNEIRRAHSGTLETKIEYMKLLDENQTLKRQLKELKQWKMSEEKYELTTVAPGVAVYIEKEHDPYDIWYCPGCFHDKRLSIIGVSSIQQIHQSQHLQYSCPACVFQLLIPTSILRAKTVFFEEKINQKTVQAHNPAS